MEIDRQASSYEELCRTFRWQVPENFNIAVDVCGRWAQERNRFALYYEDESGLTSAHTFWDIQREANRLSNVLAALGTLPGDRVAILLPQCPEAAIAQVAIYQMGALAVPLSPLLDLDALACCLGDAGAHLAIVDATTLLKMQEIRNQLPDLRQLIGVGVTTGKDVRSWAEVVEHASTRYSPAATAASDAAMILYQEGSTGKPKGTLLAHRTLLGNLSGFVCAHDFFPQPRDLFWSPADWAGTGGVWDGLLPSWHFGMPLLAYNGRFEAAKAFALIEKYGVRNSFLLPMALQMMRKAVPDPRTRYDLDLRTIVSRRVAVGEAVGEAVSHWARDHLGVTINETFGQTEMNHVLGNCPALWSVKPGAMGRAYPGHRVALVDRHGRVLPAGEAGEVAVHRQCNAEDDPVIMLGYWNDPEATAAKFSADGWGLTGELAKIDADGDLWYQGPVDARFDSGACLAAAEERERR